MRALFPRVCGIGCKIEARPAPSLPEVEAVVVERAAEVRKSSFAAGRAAAREALDEIGFPHAVIRAGADRAPIWPDGATGSISHAGGMAVAVAARLGDLAAVGIDIERTAAVDQELWDTLMVGGESRFLASLSEADQRRFATVIFCIKEAFYKYQYPLAHKWLDFREVEVELDIPSDEWKLKLGEPIAIGGKKRASFGGRYRIGDMFTLAAAYDPE